jgi:hypothetical protein
MSILRPHERTILLSQYLDGALSAAERERVDALIAQDADARRELAELRELGRLMKGQRRLEPDIGFWTRLSVRIQEEEQESRSLLPFPRRLMPAMVTASVAVIAVFGVLLVQNRTSVFEFFSKQSSAVKEAYQQTIMKGSILPLFASVDRDRALQFSLFGELPLDSSSKTALRVDQNAQRGYRIEVGKRAAPRTAPVTFDRFVEEMKPTPVQRRVIDSLLHFAQDRIASSVLVGENNALAIDPNLPQLNRVMVTGIASCFEPDQRRKLERLLAVHEAPYAVSVAQPEPAMPAEEIYSRLQAVGHPNHFMVFTPDTAVVMQMPMDFDSLRRQMVQNMQRFEEQRRVLFQRIESGEFRRAMRRGVPLPPVAQAPDDGFIRIDVGPGTESMPSQFQVMVAPRPNRAPMPPQMEGEVHVRIYLGTDGPVIQEETISRRVRPESAAVAPARPNRTPPPPRVSPD